MEYNIGLYGTYQIDIIGFSIRNNRYNLKYNYLYMNNLNKFNESLFEYSLIPENIKENNLNNIRNYYKFKGNLILNKIKQNI